MIVRILRLIYRLKNVFGYISQKISLITSVKINNISDAHNINLGFLMGLVNYYTLVELFMSICSLFQVTSCWIAILTKM